MPNVPSLFYARPNSGADYPITYADAPSGDPSSIFSQVADSHFTLFPEINELNNFPVNSAPFRTYNGMSDRFGFINGQGTDRRLYYNENPSLLPTNTGTANYIYCYFYFKTRNLWKGMRLCVPYAQNTTFTGHSSSHAAYMNLIREFLLANKSGWFHKNLFESMNSAPVFMSKDGGAVVTFSTYTRTALTLHGGSNILSQSTAELRPERVIKFKYTKNTARMLRVLEKNLKPFVLDPTINKQIPEIGRVLVSRPDQTLVTRMNQAQVYQLNGDHSGTSIYTLRKGTRNNLFRLTILDDGKVHSEELCNGKLSELRREAREAYSILGLKALFRPKSYLGAELIEIFEKYNENLIATRDRLLASFNRAVKFDLKRLIRLQPPDTKWLEEAGFTVRLRGADLILQMPIESHWYNNNFHITYKKPKTFQWTVSNYMGGPVTRYNLNGTTDTKFFTIHSSGTNFCTGSGNPFTDEIAIALNDKDPIKVREFTHLVLNDVNNESPLDSSSAAMRDVLGAMAAFRVRYQENSEFVDIPIGHIDRGSFQSMISNYHDRSRGRAPRHVSPEDFVRTCCDPATATYKQFFPPKVVEPPPVPPPAPDAQLVNSSLGNGQIHVYGIVGNNLAATLQEPAPLSIAFDPREHNF